MSVGSNIKQLRLKKDMTQQELADRLGLTQNNVTRWERDGATPNVIMAKQIANILGCTIEDLLD